MSPEPPLTTVTPVTTPAVFIVAAAVAWVPPVSLGRPIVTDGADVYPEPPLPIVTPVTTLFAIVDVAVGVPKFTFNEEEHNFGDIRDGDIVSHVFRFTNTGDAPLIISKATAACGCTVPQWPRQPIPVGGSGEIKVQFDSSNKPGMQNKVVTITANTESKVKKLLIRAQVNPRS